MYIVVCELTCKRCKSKLTKELKFPTYPYYHDIWKHTVFCPECKKRFNLNSGQNLKVTIQHKPGLPLNLDKSLK
jgi:Zn finger protein HypA/HybF involved in hydrogenase expression